MSDENLAKLAHDHLDPPLQKTFTREISSLLGLQHFHTDHLDKANDIMKQIFGKSNLLSTKETLKDIGGSNFTTEISLKQTRSGKYNINGKLCECLHIN